MQWPKDLLTFVKPVSTLGIPEGRIFRQRARVAVDRILRLSHLAAFLQ
jgi:hypothetical protein